MESLDLSEDGPSNFSKLFNLKMMYEPEKLSIIKILKKAQQHGLVNENEFKVIEKVLNLKSVSVYNVMTHRVNIKAVEKTAKLEDVMEIFTKTGFSKIPVYEEDVDSIIGVIYVKELLNLKTENKLKEKDNKNISKFISKPVYIPESMKCDAALKQLTQENQKLAVVVDEYGGTSGIVTLADIKNFVFDDVGKEFKELPFKKTSENLMVLEGKTKLKDVSSSLNIRINEEGENETLAEFLVNVLGKIPEQNEKPVVNYGGVEFKIISMENQQIKEVQVAKVKPNSLT